LTGLGGGAVLEQSENWGHHNCVSRDSNVGEIFSRFKLTVIELSVIAFGFAVTQQQTTQQRSTYSAKRIPKNFFEPV
jgi:hypothetical protein